MTTFAYVYRDGRIGLFDTPQDNGNLFLGSGEQPFLDAISARARHSYLDELLVPGIPEARTEDEAIDAFFAFKERIKQ